jgi:type II secretory pathway component PulJ
METIKEKIQALGHQKAATFMGCIYVNYLVWMNGGLQGYTHQALQKCEERAKENALNTTFDSLIESIIKGINREPQTVTEQYFKKAYTEWFAK